MKIWVTFLALGFSSYAQTPATPARSVIGEITAIDAAAKQMKLKADKDSSIYTVNLEDRTAFLRVTPGETDLKKAARISLSDLGVGDRVQAFGAVSEEAKTVPARTVITMTKSDLARKHEQDAAEWQKRGIAGVVSALNPESKEITVTLRGRDAQSLIVDASSSPGIKRYAPDSVKFSDAKPAELTEVKVGDNIRALGNKSEDGARMKAEEIVFGSFQTIAGTVVSTDPATGAIRVTDLQSKKPVTVKTTKDSVMRTLPAQMAQMMAMRMRGDAAPAGAGGATAASDGAQRPGGDSAGRGRGPGGRGGNLDLAQMIERMPP